jgi:hypothetical protein
LNSRSEYERLGVGDAAVPLGMLAAGAGEGANPLLLALQIDDQIVGDIDLVG